MHSSMLSKTALVIALASIPMLGFAQQTQGNPEGNPASATQKIVNPAGTRVEGSASSSVQPGSMDAYAQAKAQCDARPATERQACLSSVEMQYGQTQSGSAASSTEPSSGAVQGSSSLESSTSTSGGAVQGGASVESSTALPPASTSQEGASATITAPSESSGSAAITTESSSTTAAPAKCELLEGQARTDCLKSKAPGSM